MVELAATLDIERISMDLLKQSKALDKYPTPIDPIVRMADLVFEGSVSLDHVDDSFLEKVSSKFLSFWKNVRGFLDRKEKVIYLDLSQLPSRQNFVKLHETGHQVLYWQSEVLQYMDNDETLSAAAKEEFEREANYFASLTLFQHDRFDSEMDKLDLSIKAGMALSKKFGGSIHATLRRMVERSDKRCALLVLQRAEEGPKNKISRKDLFHSKRFEADFGELELPEEFGFLWEFGKDFIVGKRFNDDGSVTLKTKNGEEEFQYHFFNNNYNGFVFIFPKGEKKKSRVKYVVKGTA